MIIMSFVEMMVGTAQNIINYLLLLLYIVNCSKFIWFLVITTLLLEMVLTLALCPSVCGSEFDFFRFFFRLQYETPLFSNGIVISFWQIFFSISSMMLTISLTSKADISIYIQDWLYFAFSKYSSQLFLVGVSCCWLSVFFHTLNFKEPLSPSTRWSFS